MHYHCIQLNCNIHSGYIDGDRDFKHIIVYAYMCPTAESASSRWKCHASNVPFTLADLSANKSDRHKSAEKSELTVVAFSINLFTAPTLGCFFCVGRPKKCCPSGSSDDKTFLSTDTQKSRLTNRWVSTAPKSSANSGDGGA